MRPLQKGSTIESIKGWDSYSKWGGKLLGVEGVHSFCAELKALRTVKNQIVKKPN